MSLSSETVVRKDAEKIWMDYLNNILPSVSKIPFEHLLFCFPPFRKKDPLAGDHSLKVRKSLDIDNGLTTASVRWFITTHTKRVSRIL